MAKLSRWYGVLLIRLGSARTRHSMRSVVTVVWLAVLVLPVPQAVCADIQLRLNLAATPSAIPRDHNSTSTITAVLTANGRPVIGTRVTFSITCYGEFVVSGQGTTAEQTVTTNRQGRASVLVRSDAAGSNPTSTTIIASTEGAGAGTDLALRAISIRLVTSTEKLIVGRGQTATITARATDSAGTPCKGGITFTTTYGSFADNGQSSCGKTLDPNGRAAVELRTSPTTSGGIATTITGRIESVTGTTTTSFHRPAVTLRAPKHQTRRTRTQ